MRSNAIIRIIIWSIVILVLLGILCSVLLGFNRVHVTEDALRMTERVDSILYSGTVTDELNVRSSPSHKATAIASLHPGTVVQIIRREAEWGFITSPEQGWIHMQYVDLDSTVATTAAAEVLPQESKHTFDPQQVREIEIEWVSGSILIQPADVAEIQISESDVSDSKYAMRVKQNKEKISIDFCEDDDIINFGINREISKDLTILVPKNWTCESLEIDTASASVEVNDLTIREVEFDGASGNCEFENCTVTSIEMDTASGDVEFYGSLDMLDFDGASGAITAVLTNTPSRLDMDGMSGDMDITLPAETGFTVSMNAMSSDFSSDFETTLKNGNYVHGDGRCRINIDGMSGDVIIRKSAESVPEATTAPEASTAPETPAAP